MAPIITKTKAFRRRNGRPLKIHVELIDWERCRQSAGALWRSDQCHNYLGRNAADPFSAAVTAAGSGGT